MIEFFINAKSHFYCSRELSVFGLKKNPVREQDFFCFLCITISGILENPYVKLMSTRLVHRELKFIYRSDSSDRTYVYS